MSGQKWWAGCPEHGRKDKPNGSCHECAMLMPRPDEYVAEVNSRGIMNMEGYSYLVAGGRMRMDPFGSVEAAVEEGQEWLEPGEAGQIIVYKLVEVSRHKINQPEFRSRCGNSYKLESDRDRHEGQCDRCIRINHEQDAEARNNVDLPHEGE